MSTPLQESVDSKLALAKKKLQALDLAKALEAVQLVLKNNPPASASYLYFYGNLLWCEIILTKGRFAKDTSCLTLALKKLTEIQSFGLQNEMPAFLPFHSLLAEVHFQLNNNSQSTDYFNKILQFSEKEEQTIAKIQALNGLAKLAFSEGDDEKALVLANQSLELLIQITDVTYYSVLVENYLLQSKIFQKKGDLNQSKNYAERALNISEELNLREFEVEALLLLGKVTVELQENTIAITHLLQAKEKSLAINHPSILAESILNIGVVYNQVFHYPKALENLKLVEEKYIDYLSPTNQVKLFNYLGKSYFHAYEDDAAEAYFLNAEKVAKQHNNKAAWVFCLAHLGIIHANKKDFDKALRYAKRLDNITRQIGDVNGVQINLINLGNIHNKLEKYSESIKLTSRGIVAAKRMKDGLSEIRGYQIMAEIFRKQRDFKSAVMYQMIYTKFYEDFYQRNDRQKVSEIEYNFIIENLQQKIKVLANK